MDSFLSGVTTSITSAWGKHLTVSSLELLFFSFEKEEVLSGQWLTKHNFDEHKAWSPDQYLCYFQIPNSKGILYNWTQEYLGSVRFAGGTNALSYADFCTGAALYRIQGMWLCQGNGKVFVLQLPEYL